MSDETSDTNVPTPQAQVFRYTRPDLPEGRFEGKVITRMARTDRMMANVQVLKEGGENSLHSHRHLDGFWMVLGGRVRFYGDGDALIGEFGKHEGVLIPRGFKYWFESVGDEALELLQVESFNVSIPNYNAVREQDITNHVERRASFGGILIRDARVTSSEFGKEAVPLAAEGTAARSS